MIVSITPNTAIDYTLCVSEFTLGRTIRSTESAWGMGGKAADAAWILGRWGIGNLALGFAAGPNGHRMEKMLLDRGCQTEFVWVGGETRLNTVLCMNGKHSTFTSSTLEVTSQHVEMFYTLYRQALDQATCVVVGGSLPHGVPITFFDEVIQLARQREIPVIFDSSRPYLQTGLGSRPTVIKPNLTELLDLTEEKSDILLSENCQVSRLPVIYALGRQVQAQYGVSVVITLGSEGALALMDDAHYWIPSLKVDVVSAAGAGDAVLAGLALAYSQQVSIVDGLRLGFALATAVLLTAATADYRLDDAKRFLPRIKVHPISPDTFPEWISSLPEEER
jgi:1-phosphofructokinase family hexose kinase